MMRSIGFINIAALVASLMVLSISAVIIPDKSWSAAVITSTIIFALTVGLMFYIPTIAVKKQSGSDAVQMAMLGPLGVVTGGALLIASAGFVFALLGIDKVAFSLNILAIGSCVIGMLLLRAASKVIDDVATQD